MGRSRAKRIKRKRFAANDTARPLDATPERLAMCESEWINPAEIDREQLRRWLGDGLNFEHHVVPAAKSVAARELANGRSISGFRYLDGAVRDYAGEWQREHDRLQAIAGGGR